MITHIKGILEESTFTHIVVDVQGVGYYINIPLSTYNSLPALKSNIKILTIMLVREDDQQLYGFLSSEERQMFAILIQVSKVGAKLALTILSETTINNFCQYILEGNINLLSKISGIGKKTAERLVLELKDKVSVFNYSSESFNNEEQDALLALQALGFNVERIRKVLKQINKDNMASEELIKKALLILNN